MNDSNNKLSGRPKDEQLTADILNAANVLLHEVGIEAMSIALVSEKVGCGRGALYRRWPNKLALVIDAIKYRPLPSYEIAEEPRQTFSNLTKAVAKDIQRSHKLITSIIDASDKQPELKKAIEKSKVLPIRQQYRALLETLLGEHHPSISVLQDLVPSTALFRVQMFSDPLEPDAFTDEMLALLDSQCS